MSSVRATTEIPGPLRRFPRSHSNRLRDDQWEARHRWILRILCLHVPALVAVAIAHGNSFWHSLGEAGAVAALIAGAATARSRRVRALAAATALLTCSALLVHFTEGLIEAHFHFFAALSLLAFYEELTVYGLAAAYVLLHHGFLGAVSPETTRVFAHPDRPDVSSWTWAVVHTGFILLSGSANVLLARMNRQARDVAAHEAERRARAEATTATLTESFTPSPLPKLCGRATVAAAYRPGDGRIGGDFYEVIDVGDGRIGIGVGDVAGHGAQVAGLTAKLRHTLRAYASDGLEPACVMDKLERALGSAGPATCAYLLVDPAGETVTVSLAGHLPPFILGPDGEVEMLDGGLSAPLAGLGVPHVQERRRLPAGSTLIAYTDGLVERRGEPIDTGLRRLREALAELGDDPRSACERLPAVLLDGTPQGDDIALVALKTAEPAAGADGPPPEAGSQATSATVPMPSNGEPAGRRPSASGRFRGTAATEGAAPRR